MDNAIETCGLTRHFGHTEAVHDLTLTVPAGSIVALLGPNGAGKTTTLKLLMNLLRATRGTAHVLGADSRRLGPVQFQRIGYVSENQLLPDWMTPDELFDYCRPFYPSWDAELQQRLSSVLGLTQRKPLRTLSRGTRMKVALLASLAHRPELVVLDEPFTGLDPVVREELVSGLLDVSADQPTTILISTHDVDDVERLADRIAFLDSGRLQFSESVPVLLSRFRLVEVVPTSDELPVMPPDPRWLSRGTTGRVLRFIDASHDEPDAASRLASAFPGCEVLTSPLSLREIFIALARTKPASSVSQERS